MQRVSAPYVVVAHKRRRDIILPATASSSSLQPIRQQEQQNLVRAIAQGKDWLKQILGGTTITVIAERERRSQRMIRMMLSLAFLDPKLIRATLNGALPRGISTRKMIDAPALWHEQWRAIGLSRPSYLALKTVCFDATRLYHITRTLIRHEYHQLRHSTKSLLKKRKRWLRP